MATSPTVRVLVVDDYPDAADSLALLVGLWDHEVRVAYDGLSALQLAKAFLPDVLLLDLGLPKVDGVQLAQELRRHPGLGGSIFIAVTGYGDPAHRLQAEAAGLDHFLIKPVDTDLLERLLKVVARTMSLRLESSQATFQAGDTLQGGSQTAKGQGMQPSRPAGSFLSP